MAEATVWFDFENTPHVLFLEPLLRHLAARGIPIRISAKPQAQTLDLARARGLQVRPVGLGDHVSRAAKVVGGISRTVALSAWALSSPRPGLLVSSSRTAALAAWLLRIPSIGLMDYEHSEHRALARGSQSVWIPDIISLEDLPPPTRTVARFFAGLKENLYLDGWTLSRDREREQLDIGPAVHLVVARPPAMTAHYASAESMTFWRQAILGLTARPGVKVMVLSRSARQLSEIAGLFPAGGQVTLLRQTVSGPAIVAAADLVVSGGGTMNREAAVLGVPAWSVFNGPTPRIDECLAGEGRLRWVRSDADLEDAFAAWPEPLLPRRGPYPEGIAAILRDIEETLHDRRR